MGDVGRLLAIERQLERTFVSEALRLEPASRGWPVSLICFHIAQWRERLGTGLTELEAGHPYNQPGDVDEINDRELRSGADLPLAQTSVRADQSLGELISLYASLGDREFRWTLTSTTGDAIVRNSYFHPRVHIGAYWQDNGDERRAHQLIENTLGELRELWPSPVILGAGLYNLATARVAQGDCDSAIKLLDEGALLRPDILRRAACDPDLAALRGDPRFEKLTALA
jgi:hypothetical protein